MVDPYSLSRGRTRQVFVAQDIAADRIGAVMLEVEILEEARELLPLDHRQRRVQGIQVGNLDIGRVFVAVGVARI